MKCSICKSEMYLGNICPNCSVDKLSPPVACSKGDAVAGEGGLLPCPFCKKFLIIDKDIDTSKPSAYHEPDNCILSGMQFVDFRAWNTRQKF